jgi:tetratricopeptide (TPR) repeat protein
MGIIGAGGASVALALEHAAAWRPGAEDELRDAVRESVASGDAQRAGEAWNGVGAYLIDRGRPGPALLAFEAAARHGDAAARDAARRGEVTTFGLLREPLAQLAALSMLARAGALNGLPDPAELIAAEPMSPRQRRRLSASLADDRTCRRRIEKIVRGRRRAYPDFEKRFVAGDLRFDEPGQIFEILKEPARIERHSDVGAHSVHAHYRKLLRRRIVLPALPLVAAAFLWTKLTAVVAAFIVLPISAAYVAGWIISIRMLTPLVRAARVEVEFRADLEGRLTSTHAEAYGILEAFAERRAPFGLYLRAFETEAKEFVTERGVPNHQTKAEWADNQTLEGGRLISGHGYLKKPRMVQTTLGDISETERWVGEHAAPLLPFVTLANPAAWSAATGLPRLEPTNEDWQICVLLLASAARRIIMECTFHSPGVLAELEIIQGQGRQGDTLLVVPSPADVEQIQRDRDLSRVIDNFMSLGDQAPEPVPIFSADDPLLAGYPHIVTSEELRSGGRLAEFLGTEFLGTEVQAGTEATLLDRVRESHAAGDAAEEAAARNLLGLHYLDDLGRPDEAVTVLREAVDLVGGDALSAAVVRAHLGRALRGAGQDKAALAEFIAALQVLPSENVDNRAALHRLIGDVLLESGDSDPAARHFERLLDLAAAHGDSAGPWPDLCLRGHSGLATVAADLGRHADAIGHLETALQYAALVADDEKTRELEDRLRQAREAGAEPPPDGSLAALYAEASACLDDGEFAAAVAGFRELIEVAERAGDLAVRAEASFRLALSLDRQGKRAETCEAFARAADLAAELGDESREALALSNQGALEEGLGRREEAVEHLRRAADLQRRVGTVYDLAWSLRRLAFIQLTGGEPVHVGDELVALRVALGDPDDELEARIIQIAALLAQRRADEALPLFEPALRLAQRVGNEDGHAALLKFQATAHSRAAADPGGDAAEDPAGDVSA